MLHLTFTLNEDASVTFSIKRESIGRRVSGRCVPLTRANHGDRRCPLVVSLRGSVEWTGDTGNHTVTIVDRLAGRVLPPGSYILIATPSASGKSGHAQSAAFRITS
jgi:hypothetical protein